MNPTDQTPRYLTQYALARLLKEFATELGFSEVMADVASQVHLQRSSIPDQWSAFIANNCATCQNSPSTCSFLNPKRENCLDGTTPADVKGANAMQIERGRFRNCPMHVQVQDG